MEVSQRKPNPFAWVNLPVTKNKQSFIDNLYASSSGPAGCLYAVFDRSTSPSGSDCTLDPQNYAGIVGLTDTKPARQGASTEIGILLFPEFHRTHIASNAIGVTLLWLLDPPSKGGIGLRRVTWQANERNEASRRLALRMGFEFEGIARWQRVVPLGDVLGVSVEKLERRNGTEDELPGRHTAIYSMVWDEWEEKRLDVVKLMVKR